MCVWLTCPLVSRHVMYREAAVFHLCPNMTGLRQMRDIAVTVWQYARSGDTRTVDCVAGRGAWMVNEMDNNKNGMRDLALPRWIVRLFAGTALLLVPWTIWLFYSLPVSHLDRHWNVAWTGFDCALICSLILTAYFAWRKSGWVVLAATAAATLLLTDAWFDILTARMGTEYAASLISAACAEVPLALLSLWVAYRAGRRFFV
jgi:hypothetical protein